jgi:hypothetical protein
MTDEERILFERRIYYEIEKPREPLGIERHLKFTGISRSHGDASKMPVGVIPDCF